MITTIRYVTNAITDVTFDEFPIIQIWKLCFYSPINIRNGSIEVKYRAEPNKPPV